MDDSIFGISEKAMALSEQRAVILTDNIVNSSTPHYKARDIDFQKLLKDQDTDQTAALETTNPNHLQGDVAFSGQQTLYRVPMQKSMDGNTVDEEIERKDFIENALHYQVNLTFVQNKTDQLMKAIKGE